MFARVPGTDFLSQIGDKDADQNARMGQVIARYAEWAELDTESAVCANYVTLLAIVRKDCAQNTSG